MADSQIVQESDNENKTIEQDKIQNALIQPKILGLTRMLKENQMDLDIAYRVDTVVTPKFKWKLYDIS